MTNIEATVKVKSKLNSGQVTKVEMAEFLDISRPTLDTRLELNNWKRGEKELLGWL